MQGFTIPVLDLDHYLKGDDEARNLFVDSVGTSLRDVGFFALQSSGVDLSILEKSYALQENLFDLPLKVKQSYENPALRGQRGYISFGKEHAKGSKAPDLKEFWHIGQEVVDHSLVSYPENIWPVEVDAFKEVFLELYSQLEQCALTLLEACALYIGEDKSHFSGGAFQGDSIMRLINYPPIPEGVDVNSIRAAAHEDINLITLLVSSTSSGLELLMKDGQWLPVTTPDQCIIVDAGDMLQNVTNGYFKSTTHRVVNPDRKNSRRMSIPFFMHPRSDVDLSPLPSCVEKTGGSKAYPSLTAGEYLSQRLAEIGF